MDITSYTKRLVSRDSNSSGLSTSTTAILISLVVVGCVALTVIASYLFYNRRSAQRYRDACKKDPYLTRKEFKRRSNMSPTERIEEDELQRRIMIRKSLASRTSSRTAVNDDTESLVGVAMSQMDSFVAPSTRMGRSMSVSRPADGDPHPGNEVSLPLGQTRGRSRSPDRSPLLENPRVPSPPPHPDEFGRPYRGLPSMMHYPPQIDASSLQFGQDLREDGRIHRYIWRAS